MLGKEPVVNGFEAGTDMRLMANAYGTPGFMFGPGDIAAAHSPNEFVRIAQLKEAAKVIMLLMLRWCRNDIEED
ncbi:MAG: M20/M25/M40 family metallo-hydrolase [Clostridiales bacterium]|nr:M20/M25/M40 family metallo-hydrolase [Clostridiales bacterium]